MRRNFLLLGLGPISFGIAFGLSFFPDRDLKQASLSGLAALSATYAGGVAATQNAQSTKYLPAPQTPYPVPEPVAGNSVYSADPNQASLPGKGSTPPGEIAVFWDYENVRIAARGLKAPLAESLVAYSQSQGHTVLKVAYSNWRRENTSVVQALYSLGFEPIHVATGKQNSVDIKLVVDCLKAAYRHPEISQFIIVTADRDFVPLVNALKNLGKKVTLIGRTETASEQLLLSADEFIDLEKLDTVGDYIAPVEASPPSITPISYEDALKCLVEAINLARDQGKSTRFPSIDLLMRSNRNYAYQGVGSIRQNGHKFSRFSDFIEAAEADEKVKVQTFEGFKELFLWDENPEAESEFSDQSAIPISTQHWQIILEQVRATFDHGKGGNAYRSYNSILHFVRRAKKEDQLPQSNKQLREAIYRLVEVGMLTMHPEEEAFTLAPNGEGNQDKIIDQLTNT